MLKILSTLFLVLILILLPPTGLILISQNAVKGDAMYSIKRGLETGTLFIVSLTPYTKAYFAVALANRRYEEMSVLLSQGDDADSTIQELVIQAGIAASDISKVSNTNQRSKLVADLSSSIDKYDQGLKKAQDEITVRSNAMQTKPQPVESLKPIASAGVAFEPRFEPSPQTDIPSQRPNAPSQEEEELRKKKERLEKARRELEELKKRLEEERKRFMGTQNPDQKDPNLLPSPPSPIPSPDPSPSPSPSIEPSPSTKASLRPKDRGNHNTDLSSNDSNETEDEENGN